MARPTTRPNVPVFVSSTFTDMQVYRRKIQDALTQLEAIIRGMEHFGSRPGSPVEECLRVVQSCQLYVGVFGMRYGSVPGGYDKSMTHIEYDEAQKLGLPSLIYILDENHPIPAKDVEIGPGAEKLQELKEQLMKRHIVSFFTTPEDLQAHIMHDVPYQLRRMGLEVTDGPAAEENKRLEAPQPTDLSTEIDISYTKKRITGERHDYCLQVTLTNRGTEPLGAYHIDLVMPALVVSSPKAQPSYVQENSTRDIAFFRVSSHSSEQPIFPGDTKLVISIPYYVDRNIYEEHHLGWPNRRNRGDLFKQPVKATLYHYGFRPLTLERCFGEFQVF